MERRWWRCDECCWVLVSGVIWWSATAVYERLTPYTGGPVVVGADALGALTGTVAGFFLVAGLRRMRETHRLVPSPTRRVRTNR